MGNLLLGTETMEVPLTVRSTDGAVREVTVTTGEQHINPAVAGQRHHADDARASSTSST